MSLPSCPACGQSVLDDDAQDCPFCGSSMSAKPGTLKKSPTPPAAKPAPSPPKPTLQPGKPATPAGAKAGSDDDDPFAVNPTTAHKAVAARPKPTQTHRLKVECPMCDTTGYVPLSAAGQDVRCANPKCLVPVFKAPEPPKKKKPEAEAPPPKKSKLPLVIGLTAIVLLLAAGAGGGWYFMKLYQGPPPPVYVPPAGGQANTDAEAEQPDQTSQTPVVEQPAADRHAAIRRQIVSMMDETSRVRESNRSQPFCRQLTAEAAALLGDTSAARQQLAALEQIDAGLQYYKTTPLVEIAWQELDAGNAEAAGQTLDQALEAASSLPAAGRYRLDAATVLAAALVAAGRASAAVDLIGRNQDARPLGQFSAHLQIVRARGTYNLDGDLEREFWETWTAPQWMAVALVLGARGKWDEALEWCRLNPDPEQRIDCIVSWAEDRISAPNSDQAATASSLESVAMELAPAAKARLYARVAARQFAKNRGQAEASLALASEALNSVEVPPPIELGDMQDVYNKTLPDAAPLRAAAWAATEIAAVYTLFDRAAEAWESLQKGQDFARGVAPSPVATQERLDELAKLTTTGAGNRLKAALNLDSDDAAFRALQTYRRVCQQLHAAAEERFRLQESLLSAACAWPVRDKVWQEIRARAQETDTDRKELFLTTRLPWLLVTGYADAGNRDTAAEIEDLMLNTTTQSPDPRLQLMIDSSSVLEMGDMVQASRDITRSRADKDWKAEWFLRLACRVVNDKGFETAYEFARGTSDAIWTEDALDLIAARAAVIGQAEECWQFVQQRQLVPTHKIALCRGLVGGISASDQKQPEAAATVAE